MKAAGARSTTASLLGTRKARGPLATGVTRSARRAGAAALLVALAACDPYVQGNGVYFEESRNVGTFTGLHVEDGIVATVSVNPVSQASSVLVSGDANVVPWIETEIEQDATYGAILHVSISQDFEKTIPPSTVIQLPQFRYVLARQGSKVTATGASAPLFTVDGSEGSQIELVGPGGIGGDVPAGTALDVTLATGSRLVAKWYIVTNAADVALSGASVAEIHSDGGVVGSVTGQSRLDNRFGTGSCAGVTKDATSSVDCDDGS